MKKVSITVHHNYVEDVIKNLHELGIIEIIDISKEKRDITEGVEIASTHQEAETLSNYEIRLNRLIDILKKLKPKETGLKTFLNPEQPELKTADKNTLDELYSYSEAILNEIEQEIIDKIDEHVRKGKTIYKAWKKIILGEDY